MNHQSVEKRVSGRGDTLDIHHVWGTIQGEGPHAGKPATFIRLAGCNLQCPFCDTDYTSRRTQLSPVELKCEVAAIRLSGLVVLTGGEPFRQPIGRLCFELLNAGYTVQVETNGTLFQPDMPWHHNRFEIICSPKTPEIDQHLIPYIKVYKYVVQRGHINPDGLPENTFRPPKYFTGEIYVQPMDVSTCPVPFPSIQTSINAQLAMDSCLKHGYRLSLQMQKLMGVE